MGKLEAWGGSGRAPFGLRGVLRGQGELGDFRRKFRVPPPGVSLLGSTAGSPLGRSKGGVILHSVGNEQIV